ncbi:MAG: response regulator receiver protein [Flavisolibacter sp.]|jgi:DNA-binding response OmpR family regulator|nr:response regulator receiver protein [Flavisolibacter sp.]
MENTTSDLLQPPSPKIKVRNLVLAEDDSEDAEIFQDILNDVSSGINLSVVSNGLLLMNLLHTTQELPDIIFLDMNMPLKNGLQCLQEIRNFDKWNHIRIIILSTSSQPELVKTAYELGAELYLEKPTSYSKFKMLIKECLVTE